MEHSVVNIFGAVMDHQTPEQADVIPLNLNEKL